jgi:spore germination cell wall hydrolase CwlJ-like protein
MDMTAMEADLYCYALATYAEAITINEKTSVIHLIRNRVKSGKFGAGVCEVIYSKGQFNGVEDIVKGKRKYPDKKTLLETKLLVVQTIYLKKHTNYIAHSLYFHDDSITDMTHVWKRKRVTKVDNLIFY